MAVTLHQIPFTPLGLTGSGADGGSWAAGWQQTVPSQLLCPHQITGPRGGFPHWEGKQGKGRLLIAGLPGDHQRVPSLHPWRLQL